MKIQLKSVNYFLVVLSVLQLLALVGNVYLVRTWMIFGSPILFAMSIALELLLFVALAYSLVRLLHTPIRILVSIVQSAWSGMLGNEYVERFIRSHKSLSGWLAARFNTKMATGLGLTVGVLISIVLLNGFANILRNVLSHGLITQVDTRVINLIPTIRTPLQNDFFRFVTFTDNTISVVLLVSLAAFVLWHSRQRLAAFSFVAALILTDLAIFIPKQLVGRMRPDRALALHTQTTFSFPSGHAMQATVISGLLTYILVRSFRSTILRIMLTVGYVISVVLVALSRVYLGVHYPSDVFAGIFLGGAILTILITGIEISTRYTLWGQNTGTFRSKRLAYVPAIMILFSLLLSPRLLHLSTVAPARNVTTLQAIDSTTVKKIPLYSETLTGKTMEPISFIYIGSGAQIKQQFLTHGWYKADPSTVNNTLRALAVGFQDRQYVNAPVTPSYLASEPEDIAFQKPTQSNTLRERHHTRLWRTQSRLTDGSEIWVATASYDEGIQLSGSAKIPTHHIDPNIDAERSYITRSLALKNIRYLQVVKAQAGKNAGGDTFFTDGKAVVTDLTHAKK